MDDSEEMTAECTNYGNWVEHLREHLLDELFTKV